MPVREYMLLAVLAAPAATDGGAPARNMTAVSITQPGSTGTDLNAGVGFPGQAPGGSPGRGSGKRPRTRARSSGHKSTQPEPPPPDDGKPRTSAHRSKGHRPGTTGSHRVYGPVSFKTQTDGSGNA